MKALGICYVNTEDKGVSPCKVVKEDIKEEGDFKLRFRVEKTLSRQMSITADNELHQSS